MASSLQSLIKKSSRRPPQIIYFFLAKNIKESPISTSQQHFSMPSPLPLGFLYHVCSRNPHLPPPHVAAPSSLNSLLYNSTQPQGLNFFVPPLSSPLHRTPNKNSPEQPSKCTTWPLLPALHPRPSLEADWERQSSLQRAEGRAEQVRSRFSSRRLRWVGKVP